MRSKHTLPHIVSSPWAAAATSQEQATRRNTGNLDSWSVNASYWDKAVGDGNDMYQELVLPAMVELADLKPDQPVTVLDLATGNGLVARHFRGLVSTNSEVMASDGSPELLDLARIRNADLNIQHEQLDLTNADQLAAFTTSHAGTFDIITLAMAILELPTLQPLASAIRQLLRPRTGRFIAVNLHPAFSKPAAHRVIEVLENPDTGLQETRHWIKCAAYLDVPPCSSQGMRDQPAPQTLFHRPLQDVLAPFLQQQHQHQQQEDRGGGAEGGGRLVLDGFKELAFEHEPDRAQIQSYHNFPQFPMLVAFRLRFM